MASGWTCVLAAERGGVAAALTWLPEVGGGWRRVVMLSQVREGGLARLSWCRVLAHPPTRGCCGRVLPLLLPSPSGDGGRTAGWAAVQGQGQLSLCDSERSEGSGGPGDAEPGMLFRTKSPAGVVHWLQEALGVRLG